MILRNRDATLHSKGLQDRVTMLRLFKVLRARARGKQKICKLLMKLYRKKHLKKKAIMLNSENSNAKIPLLFSL